MKKIPIKPVGTFLLIKPDPIEKTTESGIIVHSNESVARREEVGRVKGTLVAIGDLAWKDYGEGEPWAEVGAHVYFKRHVADEYKDDEDMTDGKPQTYFLIPDLDLIGIIED